jgi:hypothetical protein
MALLVLVINIWVELGYSVPGGEQKFLWGFPSIEVFVVQAPDKCSSRGFKTCTSKE